MTTSSLKLPISTVVTTEDGENIVAVLLNSMWSREEDEERMKHGNGKGDHDTSGYSEALQRFSELRWTVGTIWNINFIKIGKVENFRLMSNKAVTNCRSPHHQASSSPNLPTLPSSTNFKMCRTPLLSSIYLQWPSFKNAMTSSGTSHHQTWT